MARKFITKDGGERKFAPDVRQHAEFKFRPATDKELKELGDDIPEGYVAGWASTPDLDHYRHVVQPGAFDKSIAEKGLTGPKGIKLLIQHDRDKPAGVIKKLETKGGSLWIEAQLNLKIGYVRDMYEAAKMVGGLSFSVGFYLEDYSFKSDANDMEYLQIDRGELEEVSIVTFPGNEQAEMKYIKSDEGEYRAFDTVAELEKALVASGLVKSRNHANRVIRLMKMNSALVAAPAEAPVLASTEKYDKLRAVLADLNAAMSDGN